MDWNIPDVVTPCWQCHHHPPPPPHHTKRCFPLVLHHLLLLFLEPFVFPAAHQTQKPASASLSVRVLLSHGRRRAFCLLCSATSSASDNWRIVGPRRFRSHLFLLGGSYMDLIEHNPNNRVFQPFVIQKYSKIRLVNERFGALQRGEIRFRSEWR